MNKQKISLEKLIFSSTSHLLEEYREISNKCGWHQYLGSDKIGNVANAQALLIIQKCNIQFQKKESVIKTLLDNQFSDTTNINLDGGWSYKTNYNEAPTTECTSWVLLALHSEVDIHSEPIKNGLLWLKNNHLENQTDIGWGSIKNDISRVYSTCLSLQVLSKYNQQNSEEYKKAINWLKKAKNKDGGWGITESSPSNLTHTSHAIITLLECGINLESNIICNGINWVLEETKEIENWSEKENIGWREQLEFDGKRITFYHYSVAWIIIVLQLNNKSNTKQYKFLLNELLNHEHNGNWVHPYLKNESQYTIWSKHDAIMALTNHKQDISDKVIVKLDTKKTKTNFNWKSLYTNWVFVSFLSALLALLLTKIILHYPSLSDEIILVLVVFFFVLLRNPIRRYFRIAQSLITLFISLLIVPSYNFEFEKIYLESTGFEHYFFKLLTVEIHVIVYVVIGCLIALNFVLDFKTREPKEKST